MNTLGRLLWLRSSQLVLVDFDFTLALHTSLSVSRRTWSLDTSIVNKDLVEVLKDSSWLLFTARGMRSKRSVKEWCKINGCYPRAFLFAGSTENKIWVVKVLSRLGKRIVWYDDLCDWNIENKEIIEYNFIDNSGNVNFNRIRCISTDNWSF